MKALLVKNLLLREKPGDTESSHAITRARFKTAAAITVAIFIASCGSATTPVSSSGKTSSSGKASSQPPSSAHHKAASLSKRNIQPVIVETVKTEFFEDYSYIVRQGAPGGSSSGTSIPGTTVPLSPPTGAIIANNEWIILTVAGNSSAPVTINNMTVVKSCQKPFTNGTLFFSPSAGAGPPTTAPVYFNMSSVNPLGQYFAIPGSKFSSGGNFFAKEVVTLKYQEPQTFAIFVQASHQYCQFSFRLSIATVNGTVTQSITDGGRPFAITSDGEAISHGSVPFSSYPTVYAGGVADQQNHGKFIQVNPKTYHGAGNPENFALH